MLETRGVWVVVVEEFECTVRRVKVEVVRFNGS